MKKLKFLFVTTLMITIATKLLAQSKESNSGPKPTIIFVHGLWADGSAWNRVTAQLQAKGYPVIAVQNPTTSLEDDIAATNKAIARAKGNVILVGHSWGGFVISEAGISDKVKALVYIAALVPDKGETLPTLSAKVEATKLGDYLQNTDGNLTLTEDGVKKAFAQDLPLKEQKLIFATQPPASQNVFAAVSQNAAWKLKPTFYLVAKNDKAINPDLERLMAKRANAITIEVDASHVPMLSKPETVLKLVEEAVKVVK